MTFEEFKEHIANEIKNCLPEEYKDATVEINRINRTDKSYDGLIVKKPKETIAPTINMDECYRMYDGDNMDDILQMITDIIKTGVPDYIKNMPDLSDYDSIRTKLYMRLSNYEAKKEFFDTLPHKCIEDLVVTYHVMMNDGKDGVSSVTITQEMLDHLGVTEERLHRDALISAPNVMPATLSNLGDMFDGFSGPKVTVVSTMQQVYGAASILYPSVMDLLSGGERVYILPSSIHEVLVHHESNPDISHLKETVETANKSVVSEDDWLSDHVYVYENGRLKIAM